MFRSLSLALAMALTGLPASAASDKSQLLRHVERELPGYVRGVDASTLRNSQLAAIYSVMHGRGSHFEKTAMIKSLLGGGYSLRGLFRN